MGSTRIKLTELVPTAPGHSTSSPWREAFMLCIRHRKSEGTSCFPTSIHPIPINQLGFLRRTIFKIPEQECGCFCILVTRKFPGSLNLHYNPKILFTYLWTKRLRVSGSNIQLHVTIVPNINILWKGDIREGLVSARCTFLHKWMPDRGLSLQSFLVANQTHSKDLSCLLLLRAVHKQGPWIMISLSETAEFHQIAAAPRMSASGRESQSLSLPVGGNNLQRQALNFQNLINIQCLGAFPNTQVRRHILLFRLNFRLQLINPGDCLWGPNTHLSFRRSQKPWEWASEEQFLACGEVQEYISVHLYKYS